jgi:hypothetical protein
MALAEILQEIKTLKPLAEENLDGGPLETLAARRGRKFQSLERIRQLKTAYQRELGRSSLFIVVTGSAKDAFAKIGQEDLGLFVSNPDSIYSDLAARVSPELYMGKETISNLFDVLGRCLEDKALELDIIGYPMLRYQEKYRTTIASTEDFVNLIKRSVNDQVGAEIAGINAVRAVVDTAITRDHSAKTTSILLPTSDETLVIELMRDLGRLTPKVFLVVAGKSSKTMRGIDGAISVKEPSMESVTAALKEIKGYMKKGE